MSESRILLPVWSGSLTLLGIKLGFHVLEDGSKIVELREEDVPKLVDAVREEITRVRAICEADRARRNAEAAKDQRGNGKRS